MERWRELAEAPLDRKQLRLKLESAEATIAALETLRLIFDAAMIRHGGGRRSGKLELGVATAEWLLEWGRMLARTAVGTAAKSPFAQTTTARSVKVKLNRKVLYELDGGIERR